MAGGTLMVSKAEKLHGHIKRRLEVLGFPDVTVTGKKKDGLNMVINEKKPELVMIGSDFYYCCTPYMVGELLKTFPKLNVAAVSMSDYPCELAMWFIINGAKSYVNVYEGLEEFYAGLKKVSEGRKYISPEVCGCIDKRICLPEPAGKITKLQREIVRLLCNGFTNLEVGGVIGISERTVYNEKTEIYTNLNVRNVGGLIGVALELGIVTEKELRFYSNGYVTKPLPGRRRK